MRRPLLLLLGVLLVVVGGCASPEPVGEPPVRRVLVVSLPGVSWAEVQEADLPNLDAFVEEAAIGDISTRIGRRRASSTDAYLTIGAGKGSIAPSVEVHLARDPDQLYAGVGSADIPQRRLASGRTTGRARVG